MEEQVMLSVIVPVYNGAKYLQNCAEYLTKQTLNDYEVIFVDDGSTDDSGALLDKIVEENDRFKVIHKRNGGTASTRNAGLDIAVGKYVTFLDCDDELEPTIYEKLVDIIERQNVDMVTCGFYFKVEMQSAETDGEAYLEKNAYPTACYKTKDEIKEHLVEMWDSDIMSNVWNKVYRMSLIKEKKLRYREGHVYTEDRVFNRLFLENCESIAFTDECLYYYVRERVGSTTEKYRDDYFTIRLKEYKEFQVHFKNMEVWGGKAKEYVCREFIERIAGCIENIFHSEEMSNRKKYQQIACVIHHKDVREAIKYAKCRSVKMRVFILPIRCNWTLGTYIMGKLIYTIRKNNPVLFHKMKNNR
ncbi:MAG: glycosyltransferase [Lachnospiraceae bacterium]|nr:glycosyltransferase [Lachnospiraceae bacterium]